MKIRTLWCSALLSLAPAAAHAAASPDWHMEFPGFKIAGNLYYVGTADLAVYLIATPQGNILVNSDYPQDLPLIRKSITQLGFKYTDTKILLISHAHGDHDAATAIIKKDTGARLMVMAADVAAEESTGAPRPGSSADSIAAGRPGAKVDRVLQDGDKVELGGSTLTARLTPGHTPGCTTWTMQVEEMGRKLEAVIIGSPNVNPGYFLVGNKDYPAIAEDYVKCFAVLKSLPADIFLGAHGAYFGLKAKHARMQAGEANPFIDPVGFKSYVAEKDASFRKEWERQKQNPGTPAP
ncbi:MAG: subclass B3 metallo-beta-lactamase [Opitutus sp.]|nr:subclass B3 metallo-beta-lactamase [Opitutus sp.]